MKKVLILDDEKSSGFSEAMVEQDLPNVSIDKFMVEDEAIRSSIKNNYDVLILANYGKEGTDSLTTLKILRNLGSKKPIYVSGPIDIKPEAIRAGATDFYQKPMKYTTLVDIIKQHLE